MPRVLRTIAGQLTALILLSVALAFLINFFAFEYLRDNRERGRPQGGPQAFTVARLADAARSPDEVRAIVASAERSGIEIALLPGTTPPAGFRTPLLERQGRERFGPEREFAGRLLLGPQGEIIVRLRQGGMLLFPMLGRPPFAGFFFMPALYALSLAGIALLGLTVYAARAIVRPLSSFARAADAIGRGQGQARALPQKGPVEVVKLARALNDMHARIRALLDERTSMLTAISHDIRTPLTRLKLRAEKAGGPLASGMVSDIARIEQMLSETLAYLRGEAGEEAPVPVDIASVLETICLEFADLGRDIAYDGPASLVWRCQIGAMTRALSNLVENGLKYGSRVQVHLEVTERGGLVLEIADDGPGIPYSLRERVFEPFFKADSARGPQEGFGLGLAFARRVIDRHGGHVELLDGMPHGLTVRVSLPMAVAARNAA